MALSKLTQEYLKSILDYDPETGVFTWLPGFGKGKSSKSRQAGCIHKSKRFRYTYRHIAIKEQRCMEHRLAWLYMTGEWPPEWYEVDHINRNSLDNRWCNLRLATKQQNNSNASLRKDNTSGIKGVYWNKSIKKWHAQIRFNRKRTHLGLFDTAEEAALAYNRAATELFGEFAYLNVGV